MPKLLESVRIKVKLLQKAKLKTNPDFKLKSAYEILAKAAGFASWREWKEVLEEHELYAPPGSSLWHVWYSDYEKALKHLSEVKNAYLIPFQKHYFICDDHYIQSLGIRSDDSDLLGVGPNWAEPKSSKAWNNLILKLKKQRQAPS